MIEGKSIVDKRNLLRFIWEKANAYGFNTEKKETQLYINGIVLSIFTLR